MKSMDEIDLPMHTAEHLLNQTMVRTFGCERCFSAHIEKKKSKLDYYFDREITPEEIKSIEDKVNEIINADLKVYEEFIPLGEAQEKYHIRYTPDDTEASVRIVRIGDYDAAPCIGPHVTSTKEVGQFRLISASWSDGVLRIRYKLTNN